MNGVDLIAKERERQKATEGWTPDHDATHSNGELALAAIAYASPLPVKVRALVEQPCGCRGLSECPHVLGNRKKAWVDPWPWEEKWDKRKKHDRIKALAIAGALIAAEIDRLGGEGK